MDNQEIYEAMTEMKPLTEEQWAHAVDWHRKRIGRYVMGAWEESKEDKALRELAEQYHTRCDAYDRTVCTGISPRTGEAMPVDLYQYRSINANARKVRDEIIWQGRSMGFTEEQVIRAIQNYAR